MKSAEFREFFEEIPIERQRDGTAIYTLIDLWEAAEKMRLERFHWVPGKGEAEMHSVLRRLGDL